MTRRLYPALHSYIADTPEHHKLAGVMNWPAACYCCDMPRNGERTFDDIVRPDMWPFRTVADLVKLQADADAAAASARTAHPGDAQAGLRAAVNFCEKKGIRWGPVLLGCAKGRSVRRVHVTTAVSETGNPRTPRSGWRQNNDLHGNPYRGLPPDALHREDHGVWLTLIDALCTVLKSEFPSRRRKKPGQAGGSAAAAAAAATGGEDDAESYEAYSDKIDVINDRLAQLAIEGRWEAFNIPCHGEYLPETPNVQVLIGTSGVFKLLRILWKCSPHRGCCATPPQAGEHRNVQQIFPFAVEGILSSEPGEDWVTDTFVVWVELMVRLPRWRLLRASDRAAPAFCSALRERGEQSMRRSDRAPSVTPARRCSGIGGTNRQGTRQQL
jgi:hypothetical protein